jgi:hypothetical protein
MSEGCESGEYGLAGSRLLLLLLLEAEMKWIAAKSTPMSRQAIGD